MSKSILSLLSLATLSLSITACVADGPLATDDGIEFETDEMVAEDSESLTSTQLANSVWLTANFLSTTISKEQGRFVKDAANGGNGKACWSHEKGFYSIGHITGSYWWLFRNTGCNTAAKVTSFPGSLGKAGVNPCTDAVAGITCTQPKVGSIVPLYVYPMTYVGSGVISPVWQQLINAKTANPSVPVMAIINPCNGPDVTKCSWGPSIADYNTGITQLKNAGITVLGYVATNYATNDSAHPNIETEVKANVDLYNSSYPNIRGIFFDEMTNNAVQANIDFYKRVGDYAATKNVYYTTVGNPGADSIASYVYTVDTLITYENAGVAPLAALQGASNWHSNWDRSNFAVLAYGVATLNSSFLTTARPYAGYTYLTNDVMDNPWDSLSSYFSSMLAGLN